MSAAVNPNRTLSCSVSVCASALCEVILISVDKFCHYERESIFNSLLPICDWCLTLHQPSAGILTIRCVNVNGSLCLCTSQDEEINQQSQLAEKLKQQMLDQEEVSVHIPTGGGELQLQTELFISCSIRLQWPVTIGFTLIICCCNTIFTAVDVIH